MRFWNRLLLINSLFFIDPTNMRIDLINNSGIKSFGGELEELMLTSSSFEIAAAFITHEAIELIDLFLKQNKNPIRSGRLITGFCYCFNSKEVLQDLQKLVIKSRGRLQVNMSSNPRFHWKYYSFEHVKRVTSYIGS